MNPVVKSWPIYMLCGLNSSGLSLVPEDACVRPHHRPGLHCPLCVGAAPAGGHRGGHVPRQVHCTEDWVWYLDRVCVPGTAVGISTMSEFCTMPDTW